MKKISFKWDIKKAESNKKKHKISFEEAKSVFYDDSAIEFFDTEHSPKEDRFILLGISSILRILVVCYCTRENNTIIRIISARKATKKEQKFYKGDM